MHHTPRGDNSKKKIQHKPDLSGTNAQYPDWILQQDLLKSSKNKQGCIQN